MRGLRGLREFREFREGGAAAAALTGGELVTLQLLARGYPPGAIATLRGVDAATVAADLARCARTLGTSTAGAAIAAARLRRLIV